MQPTKYWIYLAYKHSEYRLGLTRDIWLHLAFLSMCKGYAGIVQLSEAMPHRLATWLLNQISNETEICGKNMPPGFQVGRVVEQKSALVRKHLRRFSRYGVLKALKLFELQA
jgi:hypothetical protein